MRKNAKLTLYLPAENIYWLENGLILMGVIPNDLRTPATSTTCRT